MTDPFPLNSVDSVSAPATAALPVVPHDVNELTIIPKALYVGVGGDIVMRGKADGGDQTWKSVPIGAILPFRARYIRATGTTATNILAIF